MLSKHQQQARNQLIAISLDDAMLTFAAMNLKKMANWLWKKAVPFYFFDFKQKKTVLLKY
ncbi:hypothetical protein [Listeria monocytogenes]|uniref:hypothetical protein n=1 Tax=Listeria monocytogenes TaxID=1639 RepID=UPI001BB01F69|nr:hypothetical protein [Listeria monocytogenes]